MAPTSLRDTVLAAAVDYIADNGPDGLSFRQVAIAAGVSHQAPYHHFSDRRGIFQAIATEGYELFTTAMLESLAAEPDDPTTALLEAYVNFALDHRGHFRVMFRPDLCAIADSPELQRMADGSFDVLVDHVRDLLGPKAPLKDIRARAAAMWSLAHGLSTLLIDGPLEAKIGPVSSRRALIRAVAEQSGLANSPKRH
ncbi:MAG: TetR/AcrR family transcriptional regulator [Ilumatobacteraceae bacterium]|jgi:AcrR family transcriptional regulator|nr:TetR/AcrR family transcriptional regulator [Ilumatobacteraceae bacterium]